MSELLWLAWNRLTAWSDLRYIKFRDLIKESYFLEEPSWLPEQMPDQTGRTVIVTGGNAGIGKECVKVLLTKNAKVYVASRNRQKAEEAIEVLYDLTGKRAHFIELDLGDLTSVKRAADEFLSKEKQLHILINNAGLISSMENHCNGYDTHMHVHTLGHFYLTKLLLPVLLSTSNSGIKPRIVHLSSVLHYLSKVDGLDFSTFQCGPSRDKLSTTEMYIQSKLANILLSNELARRYEKDGLVSIAVNPGNLKTALGREHTATRPVLRWISTLILIHPPPKGAITPLWAATAPETEAYSGQYLIPWAKVGSPHKATQDPQLAKALWDWLEEQVASI